MEQAFTFVLQKFFTAKRIFSEKKGLNPESSSMQSTSRRPSTLTRTFKRNTRKI